MYEDVRDDPNYVFSYDEAAKCCLRWKNPHGKAASSRVGKECGTINGEGRWAVQFRGSPKLAHRIIWEMFNGQLQKGDVVRQIDGDFLNVKIENLYLEKRDGKNWQDEFLRDGEWQKVFTYKDGRLYWKGDRYSGNSLNKKYSCDGDEIFHAEDKDGYYRTKFLAYNGSKNPMVHRVIYEFHNGKIPDGMSIDHINGNIQDNRIENLRCVTNAVNSRNVGISDRNQTGVLGVRYRERENLGGSYIAFWSDECGTFKDKSFSCSKYGEEKAFELAVEYRKKVIEKLNGVYGSQGYHENHGKRDSTRRNVQ